eukprot:IDg9261t1
MTIQLGRTEEKASSCAFPLLQSNAWRIRRREIINSRQLPPLPKTVSTAGWLKVTHLGFLRIERRGRLSVLENLCMRVPTRSTGAESSGI